MADGCQMDSDLMRASRIQAYLKCCGACGACSREITFANDFDGLPLGLAAHTNRCAGAVPGRWV